MHVIIHVARCGSNYRNDHRPLPQINYGILLVKLYTRKTYKIIGLFKKFVASFLFFFFLPKQLEFLSEYYFAFYIVRYMSSNKLRLQLEYVSSFTNYVLCNCLIQCKIVTEKSMIYDSSFADLLILLVRVINSSYTSVYIYKSIIKIIWKTWRHVYRLCWKICIHVLFIEK